MYHYETLGDERFQEFCQALISASFPNAQCLPVGQPDGGRDAYMIRRLLAERRSKHVQRDLVVFQIKYIRNPYNNRSEREMIEEVVKKERPKIEKLKSAGLSKYYLITNLRGTAHPDVGSIDRVNKILTDDLGVEAYCWWRDDLDRRLDGNIGIKWSYPEILKATDLLQSLVAGSLGEEEERRKSAIRAYMTSQYEDDQELKFKQTELRSTMTELFFDVSMQRSIEIIMPESSHLSKGMESESPSEINYIQVAHLGYERSRQNSAEYFIRTDPKRELSRIVLEGAPGQGKSTITQYICQVMRMKLLDKIAEVGRLPEQYRNSLVRIPFRVDLRDLAKWIAGVDPFQSKPIELSEKEPRSLEGFLAGQVRSLSGGHEFNVSDLTAIARTSHIFLALDGFDEVADVDLRQKIVVEITKGSIRLMNSGGFSVQTIVTSRPAAFAKSVRFPRDQWAYFELLPLERRQVDDYTTKWMKAKGMKEAEQFQLRRILDTKLKEAHTQFLAKNPMQLTILLSLIHNRGASLPEKRTAMYDAYMDLFFSRESEKSDIVRDNRDLLVDIHRYLAWKLQTAAEAGENGSIEQETLRKTLLIYLYTEGEDTTIVSDLFNGIIERVGALVSRVQETYEFEVQPLREYFAARHLYETAPYSPAGDEKAGTKLDRFNALVRNPYWLNVARFYGGCFSKGEISALVDELSELAENGSYKLTSHPRSVALMLLNDWVFTQYQPAVKKIVALIGEYPQLRQLLANAEQAGGSGWSALPDRSGRSDFLEILWRKIVETKYHDERRALASAIVQNSSVEERTLRWESIQKLMPHREWARLGSMLQVFQTCKLEQLEPLRDKLSSDLISMLLESSQFAYLEDPKHFDAAQRVLLHEVRLPNHADKYHVAGSGRLALLAATCSYYQYFVALNDESGASIRHVLEYRFGTKVFDSIRTFHRNKSTLSLTNNEEKALDSYIRFLETSTAVTSASIDPWVELIESLRCAWGDCPAFDRIAFMGAGVRSNEVDGSDHRLESAPDLVSAARFIRLKSGAPRWWERRLKGETNSGERKRLLLLLWLWGTPKTILKILDVLRESLESLNEEDWINICREYYILQPSRRQREQLIEISDEELLQIKECGSRVCMFSGFRLPWRSRFDLGMAVSDFHFDVSAPELQFALDAVLNACRKSGKWEVGLSYVRSLYLRGASARYPVYREDTTMPESIATQISAGAGHFPLPLVATADSHLRSTAGANAPKLLDVANRECWFRK